MARREYPSEVKAQVVAALLAGQSLREIERETGIPKSTIANWGKEHSQLVPSMPDAKKERIAELLLDLLVAKIESQIVMAQHAGDRQWLKTQDASAVALLLGVSDDKLIRLLEKFESARSESESTES